MALALWAILGQAVAGDEGTLIAGWIRQLAEGDEGAREAAARRLRGAGTAAAAPLEAAARAADPELAARARRLLEEIRCRRHFLPHEEAAKAALARGLASAPGAGRPYLINVLTTPSAPASLLLSHADDADPAVRNAVLWASLRCPSRAVAPLAVRLLEESAGSRDALATLVKTPAFFGLLDRRVEADLGRVAAGASAEARFVARLALAQAAGRGLPADLAEPLRADPWYGATLLLYLEHSGRAPDAALLEPLLDRPDQKRYALYGAIGALGGPDARRIFTGRLHALAEAGAPDDDGLMVSAGHVEAFEAVPSMLRFLDRGACIDAAVHALSDLERKETAAMVLEAARRVAAAGGDPVALGYLSNMGGPDVAAEMFGALERRIEGAALSPTDASLLAGLPALNMADAAPQLVRRLDTATPPAVRRHCLEALTGALLPEAEGAAFERALDAILRRPDDPLAMEAVAAAAERPMRWDPAWSVPAALRAADPPAVTLERMARLGAPGALEAARAALASTQVDRKLAAIDAVGRLGRPDEVRRLVRGHGRDHAHAVLRAAAASGDSEALATALERIPDGLRGSEHAEAIELIAGLPHESVEAALLRSIADGRREVRLRAAHALARRRPEALTEEARLWLLLPPPLDLAFAGENVLPKPGETPAEQRASLRERAIRELRLHLDADFVAPRPPVDREPGEEAAPGLPELLVPALRSLARLGDQESRPVLLRYLREGSAPMAGEAAVALVELLGPAEALPLLRQAARDAAEDGPILLAMVRAGDREALRTLVGRLRTQDNHYVTDLDALHALDRAAHAAAYEATRFRFEAADESMAWGRLLKRLEARYGVRLEPSPGLRALNVMYEKVTLKGSFDLLSAVEVPPAKWDAHVAHVHQGDHVLLCTPVEARAIWAKLAQAR